VFTNNLGLLYEWLGQAYSQVLQRVRFNLSSAFVNFFEGRAKFPRFKSKHGKQSIQYPQNVKLMPQDSVIKFPGNLGLMKTVFHKDIPDAKTISKNADGRYYASIIFNQEDTAVVAIRGAIGVDLGLKNFAITSESSKYNLPKKQLAKLEKNRKRKQKKLDRKTDKTSNKGRQAKLWVAKVSSKITRAREDFLARPISKNSLRKSSYLCRRFGY